ncbi:TPA: neuraminidase-like domain-containing protein [Providencia alcalifaciens]
MMDSRILSRANPQLAQMVALGIHQSERLSVYEKLFGGRASHFVKPGDVSSMFSPAAYLTELYREARELHSKSSPYHLDKRRPDLSHQVLSQDAMDTELPTLALSNQILKRAISVSKKSNDCILNEPYHIVRQSLLLKDPDFSIFRWKQNTAWFQDTESLLFFEANISPEVYAYLIKSDDDIDRKLERICEVTGLTHEDVSQSMVSSEGKRDITSNTLVHFAHILRYMRRYSLSASEAKALLYTPKDGLEFNEAIKRLGQYHRLTETEVLLLARIEGYLTDNDNIGYIDQDNWLKFIAYIDQMSHWLCVQGWQPLDLYLMTTSAHSRKESPQIQELWATLKDGLSNHDESKYFHAAAPLIAASCQLDSTDMAKGILLWLNQLKPGGMDVETFLKQLVQHPDTNLNLEEITFCQTLGQLVLLTQALKLTPNELFLAVNKPERLRSGESFLRHDVQSIILLASLHQRLAQWGSLAPEILSALEHGALDISVIANVMHIDPNVMSQALTQIGSTKDEPLSWDRIDNALQWIEIATQLGMKTEDLGKLLALISSDAQSNWNDVANELKLGLTEHQLVLLDTALNEEYGTILTSFALGHFREIWGKDLELIDSRDKLYSWLLLDNQVSAQIRTTYIAEAIASIQLYINQALTDQSGQVNMAIRERPFFINWDKYNKSYSTWYGASLLAYYPENYIEPTFRVGQTSMMDEMLQTLSQSQLTEDSVATAFKTYLTRFENIANLEVIHAYHDDIDDKKGLTYLLSRSASGQYYWRSVDTGKMKEGHLPANAWTEWVKIDMGITVTGNLIRPVIFQDRLYLVWIDSQVYPPQHTNNTVTHDDKDSIIQSTLKYAHIQHNGSWSSPVEIGLDMKNSLSEWLKGDTQQIGMYCARHDSDGALYFYLYNKRLGEKEHIFMSITTQGEIQKEKPESASILKRIRKIIDGTTNIDSVNMTFHDATYVYQIEGKPTPNKMPQIGTPFIAEHFPSIGINQQEKSNGDISLNLNSIMKFSSINFRSDRTPEVKGTLIAKYKNADGHLSQIAEFEEKAKEGRYSSYDMIAEFKNKEIVISPEMLNGDQISLILSMVYEYPKGGKKTGYTCTISLKRIDNSVFSTIGLVQSDTGQQYLQYGQDKIRINSLFAKKLTSRVNQGIDYVLSMESQHLPDVDFNSANALYFWEMFYYIPMMVFYRLLQEARFTEATRWIKYIWCPEGYTQNGHPAPYTWNVRPLEEDIGWNTEPLDSVDPDAIAQADPMHYKVATFMGYIDLLIARGDASYRKQERDALNEAKMYYIQAMELLGDAPSQELNSQWSNPELRNAADKTTQKMVHQLLQSIDDVQISPILLSANSLITLFLPQMNEKLQGYKDTLSHRLYNLRHNFSLDGRPLSLPKYANPANPTTLLSFATNTSGDTQSLPASEMPLYRFPVILDSAKSVVNQLMQFGSTLLNVYAQQDSDALSLLMQSQGVELMRQSITLQDKNIAEITADINAMTESQKGAEGRRDYYKKLYDEGISVAEKKAMALSLGSAVLNSGSIALHTAAGLASLTPNIVGMAVGGSDFSAPMAKQALTLQVLSDVARIKAEGISQAEAYRRRSDEWEIQQKSAEADINQITAQLNSLQERLEAAKLQKTYLSTQYSQTLAQYAFLKNKFTNTALYSWLKGKLASVYYQFYDLALSRCLMAQEAYKWSLGTKAQANFIRPGAWRENYAGLLAGEMLMLNLTQMEQAFLSQDEREKEVTRTQSLAELLPRRREDFVCAIKQKINASPSHLEESPSWLALTQNELKFSFTLSDLKIANDYPHDLGQTRRIKQVSVTLPALLGPYQDIRCVLSYGGSLNVPRGCSSIAVSHGMNDSGLFQLDFNDSRWLPFEGIPVDDSGVFTLSFPDATGDQKALILSLSDIILHIRYTILH